MWKKKKDEWHDGERYPGGRQNLPFGAPAPKPKKQKPSRPAKARKQLPHINWRVDRNIVEKCFIISMFIVIEIMICRVFFGAFESAFNDLNLPEMTRSVMKMAQLAVFIFFTYANIMLCFFKENIFR